MFSVWLAQRRHRKDVSTFFTVLLEGFPRPVVVALSDTYADSIKRLSRERYREAAMRVAFDLVLAILPQQIASLSPEERCAALDDIVAFAERQQPTAHTISRGILHAENTIANAADVGLLDADARCIFVSEVLGALQGMSLAERSERRLMAAAMRPACRRGWSAGSAARTSGSLAAGPNRSIRPTRR